MLPFLLCFVLLAAVLRLPQRARAARRARSYRVSR